MSNLFDNNTQVATVLNSTSGESKALRYKQAAALFVLRKFNSFDKKQANKWIRENAHDFAANTGVLSKAATVADEFFANVDGCAKFDASKDAAANITIIADFMAANGVNYESSAHAAELKKAAKERAVKKKNEEERAAAELEQLKAEQAEKAANMSWHEKAEIFCKYYNAKAADFVEIAAAFADISKETAAAEHKAELAKIATANLRVRFINAAAADIRILSGSKTLEEVLGELIEANLAAEIERLESETAAPKSKAKKAA
jgi:hypothetical protein